MVEMCTRNHPFHEIDHLGPAEIAQIVGRLADPGKTLRLTVSHSYYEVYSFYTTRMHCDTEPQFTSWLLYD